MRARTTVPPSFAILAGLAILAGSCAGVLALRGTGDAVLRGAALGAGLGAAGVLLEAVLLARALALPKGHALGVVLSGFGIRLAVLVLGTLLLRSGTMADPVAFALSFVGGFVAGIPVTAAVSTASVAGPRGVAP